MRKAAETTKLGSVKLLIASLAVRPLRRSLCLSRFALAALPVALALTVFAPAAGAQRLHPLDAFPLDAPKSLPASLNLAPNLAPNPASNQAPLMIRRPVRAHQPFTVAGKRGMLVGREAGSFESWILPVKLLSHLEITAQIEGYPVPIDVNQQAASIDVRPDHTTITYAHIGFTLRQIMFSPSEPLNDSAAQFPATGPVVLFQVDARHPVDLTFRFTPEMLWMWPKRNDGVPAPEWVEQGSGSANGVNGYYVLHMDYPDLAGAVTIPGAEPGVMAPYQERPQVHPLELRLHYDPRRDRDRYFPLLMAVGATDVTATSSALGETLARLNDAIPQLYASEQTEYRKTLAEANRIETPDAALNQAFAWGEVSIKQLEAHAYDAIPGAGETALVAGYYESGDSARPGFGWFFGRDSLYTLYAVDGFGDFALTRAELEFLAARQRDDGKIMHEYSQTAYDPAVKWKSFPYMYAAADATPLFLLAARDYLRSSGDVNWIRAHREVLAKAWAFETAPTSDTDHDGIYDNSQGTGWVESWPGGMPHQEVYLALLDEQASVAYAALATALGDAQAAKDAAARAGRIRETIEREYYDAAKGCYDFSHGMDGKPDRTRTVYPAIAWWDDTSESGAGNAPVAHADECLREFAAHTLATDWGLRDVASDEPIFDGMSYHQGSVWPLFTGWAALAEYRGGQPLAGEQLLMQNVDLTWASDLGAVTELLSGDTYVPFGRSTSHQLWSSAMVVAPVLRGLFGVTTDAATNTITVNPHLPAEWDHARITHLHLGPRMITLDFAREQGALRVTASAEDGLAAPALRSDLTGAKLESVAKTKRDKREPTLLLPLPAVELEQPAHALPEAGARSAAPRVLFADYEARSATYTFEAPAGAEADYVLRLNEAVHPVLKSAPQADTATLTKLDAAKENGGTKLHLRFPAGTGWQVMTVTVAW